jgi:hypothetical protein
MLMTLLQEIPCPSHDNILLYARLQRYDLFFCTKSLSEIEGQKLHHVTMKPKLPESELHICQKNISSAS